MADAMARSAPTSPTRRSRATATPCSARPARWHRESAALPRHTCSAAPSASRQRQAGYARPNAPRGRHGIPLHDVLGDGQLGGQVAVLDARGKARAPRERLAQLAHRAPRRASAAPAPCRPARPRASAGRRRWPRPSRSAACPANDASSSMPAETPAVCTLDGVEATPRIVDSADAATYSAISTPDDPGRAVGQEQGQPAVGVGERVADPRLHRLRRARQRQQRRVHRQDEVCRVEAAVVGHLAARPSVAGEERVLRGRVGRRLDHGLEVGDGVEDRAVHLRPGAQAEEVLEVGRLAGLAVEQLAQHAGHLLRAAERRRGRRRLADGLGIALQRNEAQCADRVGRARQARAATRRAARSRRWRRRWRTSAAARRRR